MPLQLLVIGILRPIAILPRVSQRSKWDIIRPSVTRKQALKSADGLAGVMALAQTPVPFQLQTRLIINTISLKQETKQISCDKDNSRYTQKNPD